MIPVVFPKNDFKIKDGKNGELIFDPYRKQWLVLTPEEWVRQNFLLYLIKVLEYPAKLIGIEREILLGDLRKRFDIAVYDRNGLPWMLIECKAMDIPLTDSVFSQVLRYNQTLQASYLIITNGAYTRGFSLHPAIAEIGSLPAFP